MRQTVTHPWDLPPAEAAALQAALARRVERVDRLPCLRHVAGVDAAFPGRGREVRAAVAVLAFPSLLPVAHAVASLPAAFPYVPGLLSFRELPAVLAALEKLPFLPDLVLCDGQGLAHPRRFGIACHLGVLLDLPAIGVGKTRLVGTHAEPPDEKGAWTPLVDRGETVGAALRTRRGVKPVYVSIGHRVCLDTAIALTLACTGRFRLPEPLRAAHALAEKG